MLSQGLAAHQIKWVEFCPIMNQRVVFMHAGGDKKLSSLCGLTSTPWNVCMQIEGVMLSNLTPAQIVQFLLGVVLY